MDHVGSTSVPGLGGRPVLDVVLVAPRAEQDRIITELHGLGLVEDTHAWSKPMLTGVIEHDDHVYPARLYVLPGDHELRRGFLAIRDRLRRDPQEAARYAAIKRDAIDAGHTTVWAYQQAKTPYLQQLAGSDGAGA